jgi:hypothetical protein
MSSPDFENDIPESLARAAHYGTSFVPDKRAAQERSSYATTLREDYKSFHEHATIGGTLHLLEDEFNRYREGLSRRTRAYLQSQSRCMSTMITGGSNFPTARNRKRLDAADRKLEGLIDFRKRARNAILRTLRPDLQPIRSSDSDAVSRLRAQVAELEAKQVQMKAANAAIRSHSKKGAAGQMAALVALGLPESVALELLTPNSFGDVGYAGYQLQYNNANRRRVEARIASLTATQAAPVSEAQGTAARFEDDPPANRVRLYFPSKPSPDVIQTLKKNAFRWTPSLRAWQAFRNSEAIRTARQIAGIAAQQSIGRDSEITDAASDGSGDA